MAFWGTEKLEAKLLYQPIISPYARQHIKHSSYELSLGPEAFITSENSSTKQVLSPGEQISIPPGQFALLITDETIAVPTDAIAFISIKARIKFRGLVNVSGFHVDPGFTGCLKFSVYNAGSQDINLTQGDPIFIIWFSDLDRPTNDIYTGSQAYSTGITSNEVMSIQGRVASPAELLNQIQDLRNKHKYDIDALSNEIKGLKNVLVSIIVALAATIIGGIIVLLITKALEGQSPSKPSSQLHYSSISVTEVIKIQVTSSERHSISTSTALDNEW